MPLKSTPPVHLCRTLPTFASCNLGKWSQMNPVPPRPCKWLRNNDQDEQNTLTCAAFATKSSSTQSQITLQASPTPWALWPHEHPLSLAGHRHSHRWDPELPSHHGEPKGREDPSEARRPICQSIHKHRVPLLDSIWIGTILSCKLAKLVDRLILMVRISRPINE